MRHEIIAVNILNRLLLALLVKSLFLPRMAIKLVFCQNVACVVFNFKLLNR